MLLLLLLLDYNLNKLRRVLELYIFFFFQLITWINFLKIYNYVINMKINKNNIKKKKEILLFI